MSTTVELVRANERYARLRAAVGALADKWAHVADDDVPGGVTDFAAYQEGAQDAANSLRALLAAVDS